MKQLWNSTLADGRIAVNFFCGFLVALVIYYLLCRISPIPATSDQWLEVDEDATGRNASLVYGIEDDAEETYGQPAEYIKGMTAKASE